MIAVRTHRLGNGLRMVHHYDAHTQMVAVNLLFGVGSRNENPEHTGLAHLIEHLSFTGSKNAPNFDGPLQAAGGVSNAWTSQDLTNFYETLPAHNLETALWLERDRLLHLNLDEASIATQKSVVIEEFKQRSLNQPYGDLSHIISRLVFTRHPYRWPVIGQSVEQIEQMPLEEILAFRAANYTLANAVLCISGHVPFDEAVRLVEKWFADIPATPSSKAQLPHEPRQTAPRFQAVRRDVPRNLLCMVFRMCGRLDADYQACDQLSDVLGNGASSRLYHNVLQRSGLFTQLDASVSGTIDPGMFLVRGYLEEGVSFGAARDIVVKELQHLVDDGVSDYEHVKMTNKFSSSALFGNIGYAQKAETLCRYELICGDADGINHEAEKYLALTPDRLQQVASRLFAPENCSTIFYGPQA